jgi:hypothetical protein
MMKLHLAASVLRDMNIEAVPKKAVEKAFQFVCGIKMDDVNTGSNDILTSTGIQSRPPINICSKVRSVGMK